MPLYFFDLKDGTRLRDPSGTELPNDSSAIKHGEKIAEEYASESLAEPPMFISVIRDDGNQVAKIPVPTIG